MKIEIDRYSIKIKPENKQDEAYLEEVLGMKENGDKCECIRENAIGLRCIAYISIRKAKDEL